MRRREDPHGISLKWLKQTQSTSARQSQNLDVIPIEPLESRFSGLTMDGADLNRCLHEPAKRRASPD